MGEMRAFDVATDTTGKAHEILNEGYKAVGVYLRKDRCSKSMIDGLHSLVIKVFSIWESGYPTKASYFSIAKGHEDGANACHFAASIGQPKGTEIFTAFDFDASEQEIDGPCLDYMKAFRFECQNAGYVASAYGSGDLLSDYIRQGVCHSGFLAQSTGWGGYQAFTRQCSILQGPSETVIGLDVDLDTIFDPRVLW